VARIFWIVWVIAVTLTVAILAANLANAQESMTCEQFKMFTYGTQKQYIVNEITKKQNPGMMLSTCIRRNSDELRSTVISSCSNVCLLDCALAKASRKIRTKCLVEGKFDTEMDIWEDLEVPFSYFPRPCD
jgi:hypothetical protein